MATTMLPPARYLPPAIGFKLFSLHPFTCALYRKIANRVGGQRRMHLAPEYIERGNWLVNPMGRLAMPGNGQQKFLELGTGWMHFYSLYLKLLFGFHGTMFDVWDNRQLAAMKRVFLQVAESVRDSGFATQPLRSDVAEVFASISRARDFEQLYAQVGLAHVMDADGSLDVLTSQTFDAVFSMDVLEHIHEEQLAASIQQYFRVLKPGGYSIHQIGVDDHLAHYCPSASPKQYLAYSNFWWQLLFENGVQYFNRVSYDRFIDLFRAAGFELVHADSKQDPLSLRSIEIAPHHRMQSVQSLTAKRLYLVHRKPA